MRPARTDLARARASLWMFLFVLMMLVSLAAAPGAEPPEKIPPLRPPRSEIPPGFWEEHQGQVVAGAVGLLVLSGLFVWWFRRPRPVTVIPPEVRAREWLAALHGQPETGPVLSRVSQTVRRYVSTVFEISSGEVTTSDLARGMAGRDDIGPALSTRIAEFLRRCDERKFAPQQNAPPLGAVHTAEELIESVEARREELRAAAQRTAPESRP